MRRLRLRNAMFRRHYCGPATPAGTGPPPIALFDIIRTIVDQRLHHDVRIVQAFFLLLAAGAYARDGYDGGGVVLGT
jgi:hypothetical protein